MGKADVGRAGSLRLDHFAGHCAVGVGLVFLVGGLKWLTGAGGHQCALLLLFPVGAWLVGHRLPRGGLGASLAVAVCFVATFPGDAGPTAKSLTVGFGIGIVLLMLVAEYLGAEPSSPAPPAASPPPQP